MHEVRFNLQDYLADMRKEQREDHEATRAEVAALNKSISGLEVRLKVVEEFRSTAVWFLGASIVACLTFVVDIFKNHFGRP